MKKSFILYTDSIQFIEWLSDEDAWKLLKACLLYHKDEEVKLPPLPNMAFLMLKAQFDRDKEKYGEEIEKRREAWRLWGLAKASKSYQVLASASDAKHSLANLADNDNVNDTVNVNVTDTNKIGQENKQIQDTKTKKKKVYDYSNLLSEENSFAKEALITLTSMWWNPSTKEEEFISCIDEILDMNKISKDDVNFKKWKYALNDFKIYWSSRDEKWKKPLYLSKLRNSPSFRFNLPKNV